MSLPVIQEMALSETVTQLANAAVLREVQAKWPGNRKPYTVFTAEQRDAVGIYASEHRNKTAMKKFKTLYIKDSRYLTDKNA